MIRECLSCVLLVLPLVLVAESVLLQSHDLGDHKTLGMFESFRSQFNKKYGNVEEFQKRYNIFKQNLDVIDRLNHEEQGTATYGITKFADLTYGEFLRNYTGGRLSKEAWKHQQEQMVDEGLDDVFIPKRFDYRKKKAVTPVKDQGGCGSCWAFSTIANIEGVVAKFTKKLLNLSEQELLDCDSVNDGCEGGWMSDAVNELVRLGGVANSSAYPYTATRGQCNFKKSMAAAVVAGTKFIAKDEVEIAKSLVKDGPPSVALQASLNFQFYEKGIFVPTSTQCSQDEEDVDHGVTLVAFGEEAMKGKKDKQAFWVIKNSWGAGWGDKGYMKIARGINACSIRAFASTAFLKQK